MYIHDYQSDKGDLRGRLRERAELKKNILIHDSMKPWSEDCLKICEKLNIHGVAFQLINDTTEDMLAGALKLDSSLSVVYLNEYYLRKLRPHPDYYNIVKFLFAHELAHISKGDSSNRSVRIVNGIVLCVCVGMLLLIGYFMRLRNDALFFLSVAVFAFISLFIVSAVIDDKFWGQLKEFRADRIGFSISGVSIETFKSLVNFEQGIHSESEIEPDAHPRLETRIRELEQNSSKKWGIVDFLGYIFRYSLRIKRHRNDWKF